MKSSKTYHDLQLKLQEIMAKNARLQEEINRLKARFRLGRHGN